MDKHAQPLSMEAVYEEYFPVVYNYVYYKLLNREHCEDLVSPIFLKVVQNLHRYDPALATMRTWLLRITDNALIDFYRRQKPTLSINAEDNGLENTLHLHFDEEYERILSPERRIVLQALQSLPERERTFIYVSLLFGHHQSGNRPADADEGKLCLCHHGPGTEKTQNHPARG